MTKQCISVGKILEVNCKSRFGEVIFDWRQVSIQPFQGLEKSEPFLARFSLGSANCTRSARETLGTSVL